MKFKIYSPARNAMQSGLGKHGDWVISPMSDKAPGIDPLMGWTGMPDTTQQLHLHFPTKEEAIEYAKENCLAYEVIEPKSRIIKPKSYATNFAYKQENRT